MCRVHANAANGAWTDLNIHCIGLFVVFKAMSYKRGVNSSFDREYGVRRSVFEPFPGFVLIVNKFVGSVYDTKRVVRGFATNLY